MNKNLIICEKPNSATSEFFKSLRTNIQFALKPTQKTIFITSPSAGDGKSFVCSNLAITFTQMGKKVLIIDLDLRRRTQHKAFDIANTTGMSILLNDDNFKDEINLDDALIKFTKDTCVENLFLITSGPIPNNPSEILMNGNLEKLITHLEKIYDYIFIDVPPVNVVTDTSIIARYVESAVLVASVGKTQIRSLKDAKKTLDKSQVNILGVVANRVPINKRIYKNSGYKYEYEYTSNLPIDSSKKQKLNCG